MANRLQKTPQLVYVPAVPATPGRAAYCVPVVKGGSAAGGPRFDGSNRGGYSPVIDVPSGWGGVVDPAGYGSFSGVRPTQQLTYECYPAIFGQPAIPGRVDQFENFGWNGGGRSINPVPEAGAFKCRLPASPIGVQVGLSRRQFFSAYSSMSHSVVARRDQFVIVEAGRDVFGPAALPSSASIEIRRRGGVVTYLVAGNEVYQSTELLQGEAYGAALLYSVTDYVDDPLIEPLVTPVAFSPRLPGIRAAISNGEDISLLAAVIPSIHLAAVLDVVIGQIEFRGDIPSLLAGISEGPGYGAVSRTAPAIGFSAELGRVEAIPANLVAVIVPPRLSATLIGGQAIEFRAALPAMGAAIGSEHFNLMRANAPLRITARMIEPYLPAGEMDGSDAAVLSDSAVLDNALLLMTVDGLEVGGEASLTLVLELATREGLRLSDEASLGQIVELLAVEQVAIVSRGNAARQQALQYAVNFMTGALTTYRDFDFLGFTYDHGQAYAWRRDGLYRLTARGPGSEMIGALVDFGASDYGDAHLKRLATAFVGVRSDGECYLRACADDGAERIYKLIGAGTQRRTDLAKGVTGRYWNVRLELTEASYASIDNVELEVGVSQRRGYGRRN